MLSAHEHLLCALARHTGRPQVVRAARRGAVVVKTLVGIDPHYPKVSPQAHQELLDARAQLEAEDASGD